MKAEEAMTKSEDIHRMLLNMALAPISTSIAAYKTAIKEITAYIDELEEKQVQKKPDYDGHTFACPSCKTIFLFKTGEVRGIRCKWCGQAIDWEEEE